MPHCYSGNIFMWVLISFSPPLPSAGLVTITSLSVTLETDKGRNWQSVPQTLQHFWQESMLGKGLANKAIYSLFSSNTANQELAEIDMTTSFQIYKSPYLYVLNNFNSMPNLIFPH